MPKIEEDSNSFLHTGLDSNISMPTTGDEAMKRFLYIIITYSLYYTLELLA